MLAMNVRKLLMFSICMKASLPVGAGAERDQHVVIMVRNHGPPLDQDRITHVVSLVRNEVPQHQQQQQQQQTQSGQSWGYGICQR